MAMAIVLMDILGVTMTTTMTGGMTWVKRRRRRRS
jgi:hypothetical protein